MASYSATMIVKGLTGKLMSASGSFGNICIDGRHSLSTAIEIAREELKKEAEFKNCEYLGFAIERTSRFVQYKNPKIVDNTVQPKDIAFLL